MIIDFFVTPLGLLNDYVTEWVNSLVSSNVFFILPFVVGSLSCLYVAIFSSLEEQKDDLTDVSKKQAVLQALNIMSMDHFTYTHSNDTIVQL